MENVVIGEEAISLLTPAEYSIIKKLGECFNIFIDSVVGNGVTKSADTKEFCHHIHILQRMVMSQAAGRAYPDMFRLLGGVAEKEGRG